MLCVICQDPIPLPRLQMSPRTKTCSPECSTKHNANLRRASAKRQRDRVKKMNAERRKNGGRG